ncbi:hypothetical protein BDP27DRAFT_1426590 [Rhodocollybia butyracea]|uniref:Uncharacterized protein n=1 Tax=Rhodocollybia butyracea TaxID=206335 RepID=A0A9P5PI89_9AGAR|nr:hypothetical protein BDP27DRAFT_1426590 [Rhodocollybia butyracea]
MRSALPFMLIVSSILAVCPLPMDEPGGSSRQLQPSGSSTLTATFLNAQTGEKHGGPDRPPLKKTAGRLTTAIAKALNIKDTTIINYHGQFEPLGQDEIVYFRLNGGHKCQKPSCFGWIVDTVYRNPNTDRLDDRWKTFYIGISSHASGRDRFKPADECIGVHPPLVSSKIKDRWNTFKDAAQSSFLPHIPPPAVPPTGASLQKVSFMMVRPTVTFVTLQGQIYQPNDPFPSKFADTMADVIREIFEMECSVVYYGSPFMRNTDKHERVYFGFVGGNFGPEFCTEKEPCFGWTGMGPYIPPGQWEGSPGAKFSQRYLEIHQLVSGGISRFRLLKAYPALDATDPLNDPKFMVFMNIGSEFVDRFVIPPELPNLGQSHVSFSRHVEVLQKVY